MSPRLGGWSLASLARAIGLAIAVTTLIALAPGSVRAQSGGLERVDRLAREGRTNEARAELLSWWDDAYAAAARDDQQRALWLRARLTVSPDDAMRDYQRLVVLYPGGPFSDRALLRLAQASHAMGDAEQARSHVEALARDYPGSPVRSEAEAWLRDAGPAPSPPPRAAPGADRPEASFDSQPQAAPQSGPFSVQLGAFGEEPRARAVFEDARAAGFEARLVRVEGSPLLHVRVGSFAEREGAQALFERLAREGLQGAVVRDERAERPAPSR